MTPESPTPRTDAVTQRIGGFETAGGYHNEEVVVTADFARQLERELIELYERHHAQNDVMRDLRSDLAAERAEAESCTRIAQQQQSRAAQADGARARTEVLWIRNVTTDLFS